jgi:hypothetical protein
LSQSQQTPSVKWMLSGCFRGAWCFMLVPHCQTWCSSYFVPNPPILHGQTTWFPWVFLMLSMLSVPFPCKASDCFHRCTLKPWFLVTVWTSETQVCRWLSRQHLHQTRSWDGSFPAMGMGIFDGDIGI